MKEFWAFVVKEFYHIFRDTRTMLILLVMPVVQIVLFGFALSTEVKNVKLGIYAPENDKAVTRIMQALDVNEYVDLCGVIDKDRDFDHLLRNGTYEVILVFGNRFYDRFIQEGRMDVQIIADAMDPNTASTASGYIMSIISDKLSECAAEDMEFVSAAPERISIDSGIKYLYNPGMKGSYNFVPGVMGLILMLLCAMMASISIVRESELGTMEVLLVSPVRPIFIVLAKAVPYFVLSCFNLLTILLLSHFILEVPLEGSLLLLSFISLLFIMVSLSLGLLISTIAKTQAAAMLISGMVLMMPTMVLSGMIFPLENMPFILQAVADFIPAKWFIMAVKKVMIEGLPFNYVVKEVVILAVMFVVLITVSVKKFKSRL